MLLKRMNIIYLEEQDVKCITAICKPIFTENNANGLSD